MSLAPARTDAHARPRWRPWAPTLSGVVAAECALALGAAALLAVPLPLGSPLRRATVPLMLAAGGVALWRRVGGAGALRAGVVAGAVGVGLELLAVEAGTFRHRDPSVLRAWVPVAWAAFAFPTVALAARAGSAARRSACAALALLSLGLLWDPLGLRAGVFTWPGGGGFAAGVIGFDGSRGIPPGSFAGWAIVGACAALAAGRARPAAPAALAACHALVWAALAWRAAHAGIDGVVLPAAVAAALALWIARPMRPR